jgi:hypothetical protein
MSSQWKRKMMFKKNKANIKTKYEPSESYKEMVRNGAYLGKKGYTIPKSLLEPKDLESLYEDLNVKPITPGVTYGAPTDEGSFPVYRENDKKIYIPRFFGIKRYGLPNRSEITKGDNISLEFPKSLRDYQDKIIDVYMKHVDNPICCGSEQNGNGGILEVPCGRGKCLGKDTPILMYNGSIKMVQDIEVGDELMGDDSTPRKVLTLARGKEMMYKISSKKGPGYIVNESHILSLKYSSQVNNNTPKGTIIDMPLTDYLNLPKSYHGRGGVLVGYRVPIQFPKKDVEIDPYLLGFWLGDGHSKGTTFSNQDARILQHLSKECFQEDHNDLYIQYTGAQYDYRINSINKGAYCNSLMNGLRHYNLINNKHIPEDYKCNDRETQLKLLAGLIDSDGHYHDNCYEITQKNERLLDDIIYVARSLGFAAFKTETKKTCKNGPNGPVTNVYYRTNIYGKGLEEIPVQCTRKKAHERKLTRDPLNYRIQVEPIGIDDYYGFEIDGNHRFVLGDFTVTHNTVMALKIISDIQKKTLIIVHKEFLMNQWIDRIDEFLPGAKVGKIQGPVFDVEGKDIVIGMLQTLYDRALPENAFDCFGLTIIDEVHRIGSEQFSKTLLRVASPNMLGISATVDRKDKLTTVLYMFIGPKIYTEQRKDEDPVCVRSMEYISSDPEFNETEYDFKGQTKYSTMISKLGNFGPRSDFIVKAIQDLIDESREKGEEAQIMVLAHTRSLLKYFYESISHKGFASVGYYVGGMKQCDLQETEGKQIVLATYAMAAEALDIKSLSILVMATPKTDITQSVGRILRTRHDNPIVVDIVDHHDVFQKQWKQRKTFYRKCNYRIIGIDSIRYKTMTLDWENDKTWTKLFDPKKWNKKDDDECTGGNPVLKKKCLISISDLDLSTES